MLSSEWIECRRGGGERVGWAVPADDGFHVVDLLGRRRTEQPVDWFDAEALLEAIGIGYLAERYTVRLADGSERTVRIGEVSTSGIVVVADDFGDASVVGAKPETFDLPFPAPAELRLLE